MRAVFEGRRSRNQALAAYTRLHDSHRKGFGLLLLFQRLIPRIPPRMLPTLFRIYSWQPLINLTFNAYLRVAPPDFVSESADDQKGPGEQQRDSDQPLRAERDFVKAE
jgi:hypothetical protein